MKKVGSQVIYPELSYKINGVLFGVYNDLGFGYSEKYYQKAVSQYFQEKSIKFKEQVYFPLIFRERRLGNFFLDFLVEDKIILEIKKNVNYSRRHIEQVFNYLRITNCKLAILANFSPDGVKLKRIINFHS